MDILPILPTLQVELPPNNKWGEKKKLESEGKLKKNSHCKSTFTSVHDRAFSQRPYINVFEKKNLFRPYKKESLLLKENQQGQCEAM